MQNLEKLISHNTSEERMEDIIKRVEKRIKAVGDKPHVTVERQLEILYELSQFDFGCFLLKHQGINGFWTHYMLMHPLRGRTTGLNNKNEPFSPLEIFILDKAPTMLATQERFQIFLKENQKKVKNSASLACLPSGLMGELLYLDFNGIEDINLVGIDYDSATLEEAADLALQRSLSQFIQLEQEDAWQLNTKNRFDLITSNGLSIYEPEPQRLLQLYTLFYEALKPEGKLVTSFLTPPPLFTNNCEWQFNNIEQNDLLLQKIIFADVIEAKWQCFRSTEETKELLHQAGFINIEFIYDKAKLFPTVIAFKK